MDPSDHALWGLLATVLARLVLSLIDRRACCGVHCRRCQRRVAKK